MLKIKAFLRRLNIFGTSQEMPSSPPPATPSLSPEDEARIQKAVMRLYEDEALTDGLTDNAAQILLKWGAQQLEDVGVQTANQPGFDTTADQLRQLLRVINRTVGRRSELSTPEMSEQLAKIVGRARAFTTSAKEETANYPTGDLPDLNHLAEQQADLSEPVLVEQIIQLVEQATTSSPS